MEHFDPEQYLALVEQHRVTFSQVVPTMFIRMLKLPDGGAGPLRPVVAAGRRARRRAVPGRGQGADHRVVRADHPRVLRRHRGQRLRVLQQPTTGSPTGAPSARRSSGTVHIVGDDGEEVPTGESGTVYFEGERRRRSSTTTTPRRRRARATRRAAGWSTLGDVGYLDEDGFLYLTDRKAYMIITGGVNVYPQEAENVLALHPKVNDVAVFGVPNDDFGEEVKAVVEPVVDGRRRPRARARAHRVLQGAPGRREVPAHRSTSAPSSPATPPASSTSACSRTSTGRSGPAVWRSTYGPGGWCRAGRTGTMTQARRAAARWTCYHMIEVFGIPTTRASGGTRREASRPMEALFDGYREAVDWPAAAFGPRSPTSTPTPSSCCPRRPADE